MAPRVVEDVLAVMVTALDNSGGETTLQCMTCMQDLIHVAGKHPGVWQVAAGQLAALAAHLDGPEGTVVVTCMSLHALASGDDNKGWLAQAQVGWPCMLVPIAARSVGTPKIVHLWFLRHKGCAVVCGSLILISPPSCL